MSGTIESILKEKRVFEPPAEFAKQANLTKEAYAKISKEAAGDPVAFWENAANNIHWFKKWDKAFEWDAPFAKWFIGGKTNAAYNCLDRHLKTRGEKAALIWEGEDGSTDTWTYKRLHAAVCRMANGLESLGLVAGDSAAIYMPMIPEAVVAMLACARVGVTHSVIFAGFTAKAIRDRVLDAESKAIFTADIGYRKGKAMELKSIVDEAVEETPCVKHVITLNRQKKGASAPRDVDWISLVEKQSPTHEAAQLDAEHPLYVLYTSGTTGKPKGIRHGTGGYLVQTTLTSNWVFDLKEKDIYWCTADIGWVTGHSYVVYGILSNGGTNVMYEGAPNHPDWDRFWEIIDKHKVTILYTAPTAIRAFMRAGDGYVDKHKLSSLRLLGSVGEPINPEAWIWYHQKIGKGRCPIVDTWWQTETGAILISPFPGVTALKPGSATKPFPGIQADIVDEQGKSCGPNVGGFLVIKHPWPSMVRTIHGDDARFKETYWSKYPGIYLAGDGAQKDEDGYFWIMGRVDDVLNVSGHRLGTMEVESALVSHPKVAEAAVVGRPDDLKGQAIVAFVTPMADATFTPAELREELKAHVAKEIGALARPEEVILTKTLPKTRSGKIMRRLLKDLAAGKTITGDTTTLENPDLIQIIE